VQRLALTIIAFVALLGACQLSKDATGPRDLKLSNQRPHFDVVIGSDCQLSPSQCEMIRQGIEYLLQHANISCRLAGQYAQDRLSSSNGSKGYRSKELGSQGGQDTNMGVAMWGSTSTYSHWEPVDGYVDVDPGFSGDWQLVGSVLAHEEQHMNGMDGPDHRTGIAWAYQQSCMNPAA
jgi:hypothetical protein